jgi:hypothetical protein
MRQEPSVGRIDGRLRRAALIALLAAGACTQPPASPGMGVPVPLTRFPQDGGAFSGYEQPITLVVRDNETWQSTWTQVYRGRQPIPPLPPVDFSTAMVVVATLGAKPSSGYAMELTGAYRSNGTVTVEATSVSPGPRCVTLPVITYPLDIARMPRLDLPVQFHVTPSVTSC